MINLETIKLGNGEIMAYRKSGRGEKVLILVHGNMSSSKHWDIVMENMPEEYTSYDLDDLKEALLDDAS